MAIDGTGFGLTDNDDERETPVDSAMEKILVNMSDTDFRKMIGRVKEARKAQRPSLADGAKLWQGLNDDGMARVPRGTDDIPAREDSPGASLSQVARSQDYQATRAGGMNIPRGISPERLARLLEQASPGDSFQVNPDQAKDIDLGN